MKAKNRIWHSSLLAIGLVLMLMNSCKKDEGNNNPSGSITDKDGNVYSSVTTLFLIYHFVSCLQKPTIIISLRMM
jgi:hypothetical protein